MVYHTFTGSDTVVCREKEINEFSFGRSNITVSIVTSPRSLPMTNETDDKQSTSNLSLAVQVIGYLCITDVAYGRNVMCDAAVSVKFERLKHSAQRHERRDVGATRAVVNAEHGPLLVSLVRYRATCITDYTVCDECGSCTRHASTRPITPLLRDLHCCQCQTVCELRRLLELMTEAVHVDLRIMWTFRPDNRLPLGRPKTC